MINKQMVASDATVCKIDSQGARQLEQGREASSRQAMLSSLTGTGESDRRPSYDRPGTGYISE